MGGIAAPLTKHPVQPVIRGEVFIDGRWRPSHNSASLSIYDATTGRVIGEVPAGDVLDVDDAVAAARRAFPEWSTTPLERRLAFLESLEAKIAESTDELARTVSLEVGTPLRMSAAVQIGLPLRVLASYRELLPNLPIVETVGSSRVWREPVGVVAAITAWNYPVQQIVGKVAAAIATGCTVVLKPSELGPLTGFLLADIVAGMDLPAGVFNMVCGPADPVGERLVAHLEVDLITFTGSTRAGRRVAETAARSVKRVTLELGGKSANVILDDADLATAVKVGVANCFTNNGQTCTALTRMLVPRARLAEAEELIRARVANYRVGDPLDPATTLGPVATEAQRDRVVEYIRRGIDEGAKLLAGGPDTPEGLEDGYFIQPTAFSEVRNDMAIAAEEIFGPVLSVIPYDTEDDAVAIANDSIYGLAGAVWSADTNRALRVARRLRTGAVDINGSYFNPLAPFGGYKQSGRGRELGTYGFDEFYELKAVQLPPDYAGEN
jgi:aldehyde dehydrogenase (NAD+)